MKRYRQNSHAFSLAFWALLCLGTAIVLFVHSHKIVSRMLRAEEILAGVALLILGPATLAVYLIRARMLWVSVDASNGIRVAERYVIPWDDIVIVQRRRPRFRKSSGPTQVESFSPGTVADGLSGAGGCLDLGCFVGLGEFALLGLIIVAAMFAVWLICFVFIPLIVLPVLEVLAPFGDRIRIRSRRHGSLLLRDLRDADEFVRAVSLHRPVVEG